MSIYYFEKSSSIKKLLYFQGGEGVPLAGWGTPHPPWYFVRGR